MAVIPHSVDGSRYLRTTSNEELTAAYIVTDATSNPAGRPYDVATTSGVPAWQAPHPTRPGLRVSRIEAQPVRGEPNTWLVEVGYTSPEAGATSADAGAVTISLSTEVISEEVTEDINGTKLVTRYFARGPVAGVGIVTTDETQLHRVSVEIPTFAVQFSRTEPTVPFRAALSFSGKVNARAWQGQAPKTWLMRVSSTEEDPGSHSVRYDAIYNPRTWQANIIHVEQDGRYPIDFSTTNGQGFFDVYESADFNQLGLPRRL